MVESHKKKIHIGKRKNLPVSLTSRSHENVSVIGKREEFSKDSKS